MCVLLLKCTCVHVVISIHVHTEYVYMAVGEEHAATFELPIILFILHILHSRNGHLKVVRYLMTEAWCDPNVKNNDGWTPLHYACQ